MLLHAGQMWKKKKQKKVFCVSLEQKRRNQKREEIKFLLDFTIEIALFAALFMLLLHFS